MSSCRYSHDIHDDSMLCPLDSPFARPSAPWHRLTDSEWEHQRSTRNSLRLGLAKGMDITSLSARHLQIAPSYEMYRSNLRTPRLSSGVYSSLEANSIVPSLSALRQNLPRRDHQRGFPTIIAAATKGVLTYSWISRCGVRSTINQISLLNASKH